MSVEQLQNRESSKTKYTRQRLGMMLEFLRQFAHQAPGADDNRSPAAALSTFGTHYHIRDTADGDEARQQKQSEIEQHEARHVISREIGKCQQNRHRAEQGR